MNNFSLYAIFVSSLIIMSASLIGIIFSWKILSDFLMTKLRHLIALASGVFTVIIYGLIKESLDNGITTTIILSFILGGLLLETIIKLLPSKDKHHHHGPHPEHKHTKIDARRVMISDSVHNIHDGIALVPAFLVSFHVGIGTALGILLHEIVQEISEFFIYKEAGYETKKALMWNFISSSTILLGVAFSLFLSSIESFAHPLVAFAAGGFSYVMLKDLLPSVIRNARAEKKYFSYIISYLIGFSLMLSVTMLAPQEEHNKEPSLPDGFGLAMLHL
jgi:zinc and cadmium transporter